MNLWYCFISITDMVIGSRIIFNPLLSWTNQVQTSCWNPCMFFKCGLQSQLSDKANLHTILYRNEEEQPCWKEHNVFPYCFLSPVYQLERFRLTTRAYSLLKPDARRAQSNFPEYVVYKKDLFCLWKLACNFLKTHKIYIISLLTFWLPGSLWHLKQYTFMCARAFMGALMCKALFHCVQPSSVEQEDVLRLTWWSPGLCLRGWAGELTCLRGRARQSLKHLLSSWP